MTKATQVIRSRRRRGVRPASTPWWMKAILVMMINAILALGVLGVLTALAFAESGSGFHESSAVELSFKRDGREVYVPVKFWDRDRSELLFEASNPRAQTRRWYRIDPDGPINLPEHVIQASAAAQIGDYWSAQSRPAIETLSAFVSLWSPSSGSESTNRIVDLISEAQVLPLAAGSTNPALMTFQRQLKSVEISGMYSRIELLEIYLNTADYGNLAFGIDAAALVYFGKHASDLTLAESAMLAPIPFNPGLNPYSEPDQARTNQRALLIKLRATQLISRDELESALDEKLVFAELDAGDYSSSLGAFLLTAFEEQFGRPALGRNGLQVMTTIDADLQEQSECVLESQLARLNDEIQPSGEAGSTSADCLASELLPPLRPGDAGQDHQVREGALVVIDAANGEVLSIVGDALRQRPMGSLTQPFIYLTAFAEGYSPGSMVMDLPALLSVDNQGDSTALDIERYHGPVLIRTAMANGFRGAAEQMVELVGVESVMRIFGTMGVEVQREAEMSPEAWRGSLLNLAHASSVFANGGVVSGLPGSNNNGAIQPILVRDILDARERLIYSAATSEKAVLSEPLAYLINDVLSDENMRRASFGPSNPLEINRPVAATAAVTASGRDSWALGYTPMRVVAVWMGNPDGVAPVGLTVRNSAASVWHAIMKYVNRDQAPENWSLPAGVTRLEVCDPSGLLPTVYCPETVRELFIAGTEPTTFDNLYQPYLVNKETGKLATLSTPVGLVEERVYLVPPPEAVRWARAVGIEQPPQEYDTLTAAGSQNPDLRITSPDPFTFLSGMVRVRGFADIADLDFYRLQVGKGLNPLNWIQLGDDRSLPVRGGVLAEWDTSDLEGLYTLQLIAVNTDGQVSNAQVHVTVDNKPPTGEVVFPSEGQTFTGTPADEVALQIETQDIFGVERVIFYVDGDEVAVVSEEPFSTRWRMLTSGSHRVYAEIYDVAGNMIATDEISFDVQRP